jgi:hypothetical protein
MKMNKVFESHLRSRTDPIYNICQVEAAVREDILKWSATPHFDLSSLLQLRRDIISAKTFARSREFQPPLGISAPQGYHFRKHISRSHDFEPPLGISAPQGYHFRKHISKSHDFESPLGNISSDASGIPSLYTRKPFATRAMSIAPPRIIAKIIAMQEYPQRIILLLVTSPMCSCLPPLLFLAAQAL